MLSFDYDQIDNKQHILSIDVEKANKEILEGWIAGSVGELSKVFDLDVFQIGTTSTPFLYGIAHELIHAKHYLQDENTCKHYTKRYDASNSPWAKLYDDDERAEHLWRNLEEQRTVIGPDCDEISELTLRLRQGLGIRYAYQASDEHFYEDASIIKNIYEHYKIDNDLHSSLKKNDWKFKNEQALVSSLNTKNFKGKNEEGYKKNLEINSKVINISFDEDAKSEELKKRKREELEKRINERNKKRKKEKL